LQIEEALPGWESVCWRWRGFVLPEGVRSEKDDLRGRAGFAELFVDKIAEQLVLLQRVIIHQSQLQVRKNPRN
jgi:hypothetical protein